MRILVTGGAGYIGSVVVEFLLNAGHEVTVWDNLSTGHRVAVDPRAEFRAMNLRFDPVLTNPGTEAVVHLAASASVAESMACPLFYYKNNVVATLRLLSVLPQGTRFLFASTAAVYRPSPPFPFSEDHPLGPANPYGRSKMMCEDLVRDLAANHLIFRFFNAVGASARFGEDHDPEEHLVPNVLRSARNNAPVTIHGADYPTVDGTAVRDYVHVLDLARAIESGVRGDAIGTYNLGGGFGLSVREVLYAAEMVLGRPIQVAEGPRRTGDPAQLVSSIRAADRDLNWRPQLSLVDAVRDAWEWTQAHPDGYA